MVTQHVQFPSVDTLFDTSLNINIDGPVSQQKGGKAKQGNTASQWTQPYKAFTIIMQLEFCDIKQQQQKPLDYGRSDGSSISLTDHDENGSFSTEVDQLRKSDSNNSCSGHFQIWEHFQVYQNITGRGTPPQS